MVDPQRRLLREGPAQVQLPAPAGAEFALFRLLMRSNHHYERTGPGVAVPDAASKAKKAGAASYIFLFNDLLLFTKAPTLSRTTYNVVGQLEMQKAKLVDEG